MSRAHLPGQTALRGIAALWVVLFHFNDDHPLLHGSALVTRGYLWVDFFFVLSGFVLAHVYGETFAGGVRKADLRAFLRARFARIWPLHAATTALLGLGVLLTRWRAPETYADLAPDFTARALALNAALLHCVGLTGGLTWNGPSWSIAAEWWVYLLVPWGLTLLRRPAAAGVTAALALGGLWLFVARYRLHSLDATYDFGLVRCLLDVPLGICAYTLWRTGWARGWLARDLALALAATTVLLALDTAPDPMLPPLFAALVLCAASNAGRGAALLETRPLRTLGDLSYALYLVQNLWLLPLAVFWERWRDDDHAGPLWNLPTPAWFAATVAVCLGAAALLHRLVEKPARNAIRRRAQGAQARM